MKIKVMVEYEVSRANRSLPLTAIRAALRIYIPSVEFTVSEVRKRGECPKCGRNIAVKNDGSFFGHVC